MPRYELMYLLGATVADTDVQPVSDQVRKFIEDLGGTNVLEEQLGKKKLAYPIGKTRNGNYVVATFTMDGPKVQDLDARLRTQENTIIRYMIVNLDDHLKRLEKDRAIQATMVRRQPVEETKAKEGTPAPKAEVDEKIEDQIEAALSEDVSKS